MVEDKPLPLLAVRARHPIDGREAIVAGLVERRRRQPAAFRHLPPRGGWVRARAATRAGAVEEATEEAETEEASEAARMARMARAVTVVEAA